MCKAACSGGASARAPDAPEVLDIAGLVEEAEQYARARGLLPAGDDRRDVNAAAGSSLRAQAEDDAASQQLSELDLLTLSASPSPAASPSRSAVDSAKHSRDDAASSAF